MLVIYEHLNILAMFCYNLYPAQPEEDWPPHICSLSLSVSLSLSEEEEDLSPRTMPQDYLA